MDGSNTFHKMIFIDVRLLDIVVVLDVILVAHMATISTIYTRASWNGYLNK